MAFVRTLTFIIPAEQADQLEPGHNLNLALVYSLPLVAQNVSGYHRCGVWSYRTENGNIKVKMYTQWYTIPDLENYSNTPMVRDFEATVAENLSTPQIEIYEVIG